MTDTFPRSSFADATESVFEGLVEYVHICTRVGYDTPEERIRFLGCRGGNSGSHREPTRANLRRLKGLRMRIH